MPCCCRPRPPVYPRDCTTRWTPRRLDVAAQAPSRILETASRRVERVVDGHGRVLVPPVQFVALVGHHASPCGERRLVIDDHVLARQRQLDSHVKAAAMPAVPVRQVA